MTKTQAIKTAKKLKTLAEKSEGGERATARIKLKSFCEKHDLNPDEYSTDLIKVTVSYASEQERSLLSNVVCMVMDEEKVRGKNENRSFTFSCTPTQFEDITDAFAYYKRLYYEYADALIVAIISKNEVINSKEGEIEFSMEEMTDEEKKEYEETMKGFPPPPNHKPPPDSQPPKTNEKSTPEPRVGMSKDDMISRFLLIMEQKKWKPRYRSRLFLH